MESIKQIQTDIHEIKNSTKSLQNQLNESEDSISDLEAGSQLVMMKRGHKNSKGL